MNTPLQLLFNKTFLHKVYNKKKLSISLNSVFYRELLSLYNLTSIIFIILIRKKSQNDLHYKFQLIHSFVQSLPCFHEPANRLPEPYFPHSGLLSISLIKGVPYFACVGTYDFLIHSSLFFNYKKEN